MPRVPQATGQARSAGIVVALNTRAAEIARCTTSAIAHVGLPVPDGQRNNGTVVSSEVSAVPIQARHDVLDKVSSLGTDAVSTRDAPVTHG